MGAKLLVPPNKEEAFCLREFFMASVKYKFSDVMLKNLVAMLSTKSGMEYVLSRNDTSFQINSVLKIVRFCACVQPYKLNQYLLY